MKGVLAFEAHLNKGYQRHRTLGSLSSDVGGQQFWLNRQCERGSLMRIAMSAETVYVFNPPVLQNHLVSWSWEKYIIFSFGLGQGNLSPEKDRSQFIRFKSLFHFLPALLQAQTAFAFPCCYGALQTQYRDNWLEMGRKLEFSFVLFFTFFMSAIFVFSLPIAADIFIWRNLHFAKFAPSLETPNVRVHLLLQDYLTGTSVIEMEVKGQMVKEGGRQKYVGSLCIKSIKAKLLQSWSML